MERKIEYCSFDDAEIKPMEYALTHFGVIPSILVLEQCILEPKVYESLLSLNFNGNVRRIFESTEKNMLPNVDQAHLLTDIFVTAVDVSKTFYETYTNSDQKQNTVVLSCYMNNDTLDYVQKKRKPQLKCRVTLYYTKQQAANDFLKILTEENLITFDKEKVIDHNSYINLVVKNSDGELDTSRFEIKNPKINIPLSYGTEFVSIEQQIYKTLIQSDKGLWIFHGPPGTGKSMYIRHIIKQLNKSGKVGDIIYMPSEMVGSLESPDFIPFIQNYPDAILVIEDGDVALESRKNHGSIVKTILQLTDGILADCLRLKIIVTFNCELSKIDEALLRKGRLQIRHEFRYLTRTEAIELAKDLQLDISIFDSDENKNKKDWTLAEIYNIHTDFYWDKKQKKLGFGS